MCYFTFKPPENCKIAAENLTCSRSVVVGAILDFRTGKKVVVVVAVASAMSYIRVWCVYRSDKNGSSRFDSLRFPPNPLSSCNLTSLRVCYVYKAHHLFFSHTVTVPRHHLCWSLSLRYSTVSSSTAFFCSISPYICTCIKIGKTTSSVVRKKTIFVIRFIYTQHYPTKSWTFSEWGSVVCIWIWHVVVAGKSRLNYKRLHFFENAHPWCYQDEVVGM